MIDSSTERLITLAEAAERYPRPRRGKTIHLSTIHRHASVGCRGVVLETMLCGGLRATSVEALQRFFERLTAVADGTGAAADTSNPPATRRTRKIREQSKVHVEEQLSRIFGRRDRAALKG